MKKKFAPLCLLIVFLITSGCVNKMIGQKITVQNRIGEENTFADFREITQRKQVTEAIDIVKNAEWESTEINMEHDADYQFQFPFKNDKEDKITSYSLWISPNGENLEIVTDSDRYVKLTKHDSTVLYKILKGEELVK